MSRISPRLLADCFPAPVNFLVVLGLLLSGGCSVPGPPQYDHAMLRDYFGKSQQQIRKQFGKPAAISMTPAAATAPPDTGQSQTSSSGDSPSVERERYEYELAGEELVFYFDQRDRVYKIRYQAKDVSPN